MICNSQHKKKYPEEACIVLSTMESFAGKKDFWKKDWTDDLRKDYGYAQHINTKWVSSLVYKKLQEICDDMKSHPEIKNIHFILDTHGSKKKKLVDMSSVAINYFDIALSNIKAIMQQRDTVKLYFDNWACYDADHVDDIHGEQNNIYEKMINCLGSSLSDRTYCKSIERNLLHWVPLAVFTNPYKNVAHFGCDNRVQVRAYNSFQYFPLKDYKNRQDPKRSGCYGGQEVKNKFFGKRTRVGCCGWGIF